MKDFAGVAQLVEQRIRNARVGGSIPLASSLNVSLNTIIWADTQVVNGDRL